MKGVKTLNRGDKKLCSDFGIEYDVKIELVKLRNFSEENGSKNSERSISKDSHRTALKNKRVQARQKIVQCSVCQYLTRNTSRLTAHMKTHTRERNFKCTHNDCSGKSFSSKGNLARHMKLHTRAKTRKQNHNCTFCSQEFQSNSELISHMWKHTGEKPFYCEMCKQGFTSKTAKSKHETTHCKFRQSTSDSNKSENDTVDNYWSNWRKTRYLLRCEWCDYSTTRTHELRKHNMATHTGEILFSCTECQRKFSTNSSLQRHAKTHSGLKPFKCTHCDYSSAERSRIGKHVASIHNKETRQRNFKCVTCGNAYFTKEKLQHHNKQHSIKRAYYACQFCQSKYTENYSKTSHEKRCKLNPNHTKDLYKCGSCEFETIWKGGVERHMKIHTGDKPFACNLCPYKCSEKYVLDNHIRRHTGEKNYKCKYCKYSCTSSGSMERHVRTHTKEKPYKCGKCGFSTAHQGHLKDHMKRHKGIKPHSCPHCSYRSVTMADVRRHINSMHTSHRDT